MKEKLSIALGTDNFRKLVTTSDVFVDKTLFIKEIIDSGDEAILITRPRRWGKSLALNMLKTFLAVEVEANGTKVATNSNRVLFEGGAVSLDLGESKTLEPLKIAREDLQYLRKQGQYPLIHVSFKDVYDDSYESVQRKIKEAVTEVFEKHYYLKDSEKLNALQKGKLTECFEGQFERVSLSNSLKFLSEVLHIHHETKVYVLIDEYDKPVNYFLGKSLTTNIEARTQVAQLMTSIMSACGKSNDSLQKIIITGILDAFKKEGASGFNNVKIFDVQHPGFARSFGFSQEEVGSLVNKLAFEAQHDVVIESIKAWYNGYNVVTEGADIIQVYTPWAVMNYLSDAYNYRRFIPKSFWVESGVDAILDNLSGTSIPSNLLDKLKDLAEDKSTLLSLTDNFHLLKSLTDDTSKEALITYLLLSNGYISKKGELFIIPNNEVLHYFNQQVLKAWIEKEIALNKLGAKDVLLKEISVSLSDATEFKKKVQERILNKIGGGDKTESYFQSLVGAVIELYAITSGAEAAYNVLSEKTVRFGRIDNIFYPRGSISTSAEGASAVCALKGASAAAGSTGFTESGGTVIIHEYKKLDTTALGEITKVLYEAMWQIFERGYLAEPLSKKEAHGHSHVWDSITIRSVVFIRDESKGKWSIDIVEKKLAVDQAMLLERFFSDKLVREALGMNLKTRKLESSRQQFLQTLNKGAGTEIEGLSMLLDSITATSEYLLNALRKHKLEEHLKNTSQADKALAMVVALSTLSCSDIAAKIKTELSEEIPPKVIELLVSSIKEKPLSVPRDIIIGAHSGVSIISRSSRRRKAAIEGKEPEMPSNGLTLTNVPGDGNCFFHAVERQLIKINAGGESMGHLELRQFAVNYVRAHRAEFTDFIVSETPENYIDRMERSRQWADHVIIKALALELSINIVILEPRAAGGMNAPIVITKDGSVFDRTIFLYHVPEIHYQSIETIDVASPVLNGPLGALRGRGIDIPELFRHAPIGAALACAGGVAFGGADMSVDEVASSRVVGSSSDIRSSVSASASCESMDAGDAARAAGRRSYRSSVAGSSSSSSGTGSSSGSSSSAAAASSRNTTLMCMAHVLYDNPIFNDNARSGGNLFKAAFKVGGIDLVTALIEQGSKHTPKASHILEYIDSTGQIIFSFDSVSDIDAKESLAQPVLRLKPVETAEVIVARESAADSLYMPFIDLIRTFIQAAALFEPGQLTGKIMYLIQQIGESTLPELQTDTQVARISFLFELLDHVGSADSLVIPPYFPHPEDPDDFGGGGGSGGDKKSDGIDSTWIPCSHYSEANISISGSVEDINVTAL